MNLKAIRNGTGSLNFLDFAATAAIYHMDISYTVIWTVVSIDGDRHSQEVATSKGPW